MYDLQNSDLAKRVQYNIKEAISFPVEGVLATAVDDGNGNAVVQPSGGTSSATENVVGFALLPTETITQEIKYEQLTIPTVAPYTVQLQTATPVILISALAEASAYNGAVPYTQVAVPSATTEFNVSATGMATFDVADAGKVIDLYVRANITVTEAVMRYGQSNINNNYQVLNSMMIACGKGRMYTMEYDVTQQYAIGGLLYTHNTLAAGQVTSDNTSGKVIGVCVSVPDTSTRYLGIDYNI
ncbi:hypothetical protein KAU11_08495 [Candidatus Babeliales bacterium]|nr:hypothetical protein [Candidatus Babeliales bacterium]